MSNRFILTADKTRVQKALTTKQVEGKLKNMVKAIEDFFNPKHVCGPRVIATVNENGKNLLKALREIAPESSVLRSENVRFVEVSIDRELVIDYAGAFPVCPSFDYTPSVVVLGGVCSSGRELHAVKQFVDRMLGTREVNYRFMTWVAGNGACLTYVSNAVLYLDTDAVTSHFWTGYGLNIQHCPDEANGELYGYEIDYIYKEDFKDRDRSELITCATR